MDAWLLEALPSVDPVFGHAAAAGVGLVLLLGALEKLCEPGLFRDTVDNYRLLPKGAVAFAALALPLAELLAGILLLPVATRPIGAALALLLLLIVTSAVAINLHRGRDHIDCGCGGDVHTPLSRGLVIRNGLLMLLTFAASLPASPRVTVWLDLGAVSFASLFLLGLYFLANAMLSHQSLLLDLRHSP